MLVLNSWETSPIVKILNINQVVLSQEFAADCPVALLCGADGVAASGQITEPSACRKNMVCPPPHFFLPMSFLSLPECLCLSKDTHEYFNQLSTFQVF